MFPRNLFTKSSIPMRFIRQFNQTTPVESKDVKQETGTDLKAILASKIPGEIDRIKKFRKEHGNTVVSKVTVNMIYSGMRGILGLIYETSLLDPNEGIRFRGYSIKDCQKLIPTAAGGTQPLPEGLFWLLITGSMPTKEQVNVVSKEWAARSKLPDYCYDFMSKIPKETHPMAQLSAICCLLNNESLFAKAYTKGIHKSTYWEYVYEDTMNLIGKIITVAAMIYTRSFKNLERPKHTVQPDKDWSYNFSQMLGYDSADFIEFLRLYLVIHSDHEGGNVSAHANKLVGSALSDPYLAFAACMNGLAGPLHGRANQEVLEWIIKIQKEIGDKPSEQALKDFIWKLLKSGQVVPGYGHAVLRKTDPRYDCQKEFAAAYIKNDPLVNMTAEINKVVPPILTELGKVQNPWPNVDAHSGVILYHYGMKEMSFYTVLFGVSRLLGVMASLVWDRALGMSIERPKSITTDDLMRLVKTK